MKIFANHAHVFPKSIREDGDINTLLRIMDKCEIEKAVAFAPFKNQFGEGNQNAWLSREIKNNDQLLGFGTIDFNNKDIEKQVEEIKQLGLLGIKLHPAYQKFNIMCPQAQKIYQTAEKLNLPICFHTGVHWHRIKDYNMLLFDEVAYNYKKLKISLEHVGGYSFFKEGVAIMINNPHNTFAGLTSVFDRAENKFWYLGEQLVEELIWQTNAERCIFGLDFPYNNEQKIKKAIESIKNLNITKQEKEKILSENLKNFIYN